MQLNLLPGFMIVSNHYFKYDILHPDQILQLPLIRHSINHHIYLSKFSNTLSALQGTIG